MQEFSVTAQEHQYFLEGDCHPLSASMGCCYPVYLYNKSLLLANIVDT